MNNDVFTLLSTAHTIEVFTGAGMSAESGLPTYRNDETGLWENVDPQDMASIDSWYRDPKPMWAWYLWRTYQASQAMPNGGHRAIGEWENIASVHVITQNIDNLHERGGSHQVTHLHGSLFEFRCTDNGHPYELTEIPDSPMSEAEPPLCPLCGSYIRPGVVWFGEALPQKEWEEAEERMKKADAVVIVGTSGTVYPAAQLPIIAQANGAKIIEISPAPTDFTPYADVSWRTTAEIGLEELIKTLKS